MSMLNRILHGRSSSYQIISALKEPTVWKAKVLQPSGWALSELTSPSQELVVVKDVVFKRELSNHQLPPIALSPHIRHLRDLIENYGANFTKKGMEIDPSTSGRKGATRRMVLEWMDTDLWHIRPYGNLSNRQLPKIVAKSVLAALAVFHGLNAVHTDLNPNNVLLSRIDSDSPVVKIGDLGQAIIQGVKSPRGQSLETRAPEVWRGLGIWPASDIWSLGVTLSHWLMSRPIFGMSDKTIEGETEAWCLAKIRRLVGPVGSPDDPAYEHEFRKGEEIEQAFHEDPRSGKMIATLQDRSLREELQRLGPDVCSPECIDFISYLMVVDHTKRPTAAEALKHPFITSED